MFGSLERVIRDVRFANRSWRRTPAVALVATITLAAGITVANTTFAIVNGARMHRLPFSTPERLVHVGFKPLRAEYVPERLQATYVSALGYELLGIKTVAGRGIRVEDDEAAAAPVSLISDTVWRSQRLQQFADDRHRRSADPRPWLTRTLAIRPLCSVCPRFCVP
jgi:hypothetical protein